MPTPAPASEGRPAVSQFQSQGSHWALFFFRGWWVPSYSASRSEAWSSELRLIHLNPLMHNTCQILTSRPLRADCQLLMGIFLFYPGLDFPLRMRIRAKNALIKILSAPVNFITHHGGLAPEGSRRPHKKAGIEAWLQKCNSCTDISCVGP